MVSIGYPCYDNRCEAVAMQTLMQCLYDKSHPVKGIIMQNGDSLVTRARNKTVHDFLKTDNEYLLFIDNDIMFRPDDIVSLVNRNLPIVGGLYFKKKLPYSPVLNTVVKDYGNGLIEVAELGTGFLMIHRDVFIAIRNQFPENTYKNESDEADGEYYDYFRVGVFDGRYLSEDYYFCAIARKAGFKVFCDTTALVRHAGRAVYPFDDTTFLEAGADFLHKYDLTVPMDKRLFDAYETAIKHQRENRTWNS